MKHGEEVRELELLQRNKDKTLSGFTLSPCCSDILVRHLDYLCFNRFGVLVLEQKLDFAFPVIGRSFELRELVSPQNGLKHKSPVLNPKRLKKKSLFPAV